MATRKKIQSHSVHKTFSVYTRTVSYLGFREVHSVGLFLCFLLVFGAIIYRLYHIGVIDGAEHTRTLTHQYEQVITSDDVPRGNVYFSYRDGSRLLVATDQEYDQLVINNRNVRDQNAVVRALKQAQVEYSPEKLEVIFSQKNDPYEILSPRVSKEQSKFLRENRTGGIELHVKRERYYPLRYLGSELVGFTSFHGDDVVGTYGLEKHYDNILRQNGEVRKESLLLRLFGYNDTQEEQEVSIEKHIERSGSLVASIEPEVQSKLSEELEYISEQFTSEITAGIIMDARTGSLVAMASTGRFDVNKNKQHYRNPLVENRYEFGSIMKPFTVALALEEDVIDPSYTYHDYGHIGVDDYTIRNFDRKGRGASTDLQTILSQSLNTGVASIALKVGAETFLEYMKDFGFGTETGIDLPYEVYGVLDNINTGRDVELATASFGQGIATTAIEMARGWGVLANDGIMETPHIVELIEYGDLIPARNIPAFGGGRILSKKVSDTIRDYLVQNTDESYAFRKWALPNHSIAVKTGTAQLPEKTGGYHEDEFLHSMAGFFPAHAAPDEPRYVAILFTVRPRGVEYAAGSLTKSFFNLAHFMVTYYELAPDRNISPLDNLD